VRGLFWPAISWVLSFRT